MEYTVTGYHIINHGDPTVGVPETSWELTGDFLWHDQQEEDSFIYHIQNAFEYACGERVKVISFEEYMNTH